MAIRHLDCDRTIIPHQHQSLPGNSEQEAGTRIKSSLAQRKKVWEMWVFSSVIIPPAGAGAGVGVGGGDAGGARRCGGSPSPRRDWSLWEAAVPL